MPALFALGQHQALEAIQESLQPSETLMAFLDDVYATTPPERTATVEQSVEANLWSHARIQVNQKTQVWNRCGERPPDCDQLFFRSDSTPNDVWRGDPALPTALGCTDFVEGSVGGEDGGARNLVGEDPKGVQSPVCVALVVVSVQHQEPVTLSELSTLNTVSSSPFATMQGSGSALKSWCTPQSHSQCGKWPVCHLGLVV